MAQNPKVVPAEYPEHIQKFLFACAFWIVAADEQLTQGEQRWLTEQFGPRKTAFWLEEMTALQGARFFQVFDKLAAGLGENDKRRIYPALQAWLSSCAASDAAGNVEEREIIGKIKARLMLDAQVARFGQGLGTQHARATPGSMSSSAPTASRAPSPPRAPTASRPPTAPIPAATHAVHGMPEVAAASAAAMPANQVNQEPEQEHRQAPTVPARVFRGHGGEVLCACFDPRGATAFSGAADRTLRSWDVPAGVETRTFAEQEAGVSALAFSPDGVHLFSGNMAGTVIRWNAGSGGRTWQVSLDDGDAVTAVSVSSDGEVVAAARECGLISVMKAEDGHLVKTLGVKGAAACDVCFSRKGRLLLCGGDDKVVKAWDGASETWTSQFAGHNDAVLAVRMSPDGRIAASGSADKTVKLWDIQAGREIRSLAGHEAPVHGLDFSHDGLFLVSASEDGVVRAWETATGREGFSVRLSTQRLGSVAFHPSGRSVLVCGSDHQLYLLEHPIFEQAGA